LISGQADAATAKRAHDDAKVQLAAAQTTAGRAPARRRGAPAARRNYYAAVARAFASPEFAAKLQQQPYGVATPFIRDWLCDREFPGVPASQKELKEGVLDVLKSSPEYIGQGPPWNPSSKGALYWRRVPVAEMDLEAPPPAVQAPQAMDVAEPAPPPVAPSPVAPVPQAPSPAVVAPTPPRAPADVAWDFDTPVYSVEAKFASHLKHFIKFGHYLEDEPNLTLLDRMGEVHGLVVVVETADEKFALVGATPKIAAGIRSGKFWAATQGEDLFFATVKSDARRL
jgi:hypothetical protein